MLPGGDQRALALTVRRGEHECVAVARVHDAGQLPAIGRERGEGTVGDQGLALSDSGAPSYDATHAAALAAIGVPAFACTPDQFPDLMAAAIEKRDLAQWAAANDIAIASAVEED